MIEQPGHFESLVIPDHLLLLSPREVITGEVFSVRFPLLSPRLLPVPLSPSVPATMPSATKLALLASAVPMALAQSVNDETILGVYMFHRHGDRTAKMTPPANLTGLGYQEVYTSGQYYRSRYIASDAAYRINGIEADTVKQSQIAVSAPADVVLQSSAMGFLQGLYPPVGGELDTSTLRNGTRITAPMDGYQLIPIGLVGSGSGSEDNGWLQRASGCAKATVSSNNYFLSQEYMDLLDDTQDFYQSILPAISGTYNSSMASYKNAYTSG